MKFMSKNMGYEINLRPRFNRSEALNNPDLAGMDPRGWQVNFDKFDPLTKMWIYDTDADPRLQGESNSEFKAQIEKELADHETRDPQYRHYAPPATVEVPYSEIEELRAKVAAYEVGELPELEETTSDTSSDASSDEDAEEPKKGKRK